MIKYHHLNFCELAIRLGVSLLQINTQLLVLFDSLINAKAVHSMPQFHGGSMAWTLTTTL